MPLVCHLLASAAFLTAGTPSLQLNVFYNCKPDPHRIKILSCAGEADDSICEVQSYTRSEPGTRRQSTRKAILISLQHCHPVHAPSNAFKPGDSLEVFLFGEWTKSELLSVDGGQYNVRVSDGAKYWLPANQIRKAGSPAPAGQPPRPGLTSCAGKIDGTYSSPSGFPTLAFHSGKASIEGDEPVECWTAGEKIYLHTPGAPAEQDFVMGINTDGTLDTPLGEIHKKGN